MTWVCTYSNTYEKSLIHFKQEGKGILIFYSGFVKNVLEKAKLKTRRAHTILLLYSFREMLIIHRKMVAMRMDGVDMQWFSGGRKDKT